MKAMGQSLLALTLVVSLSILAGAEETRMDSRKPARPQVPYNAV